MEAPDLPEDTTVVTVMFEDCSAVFFGGGLRIA